MTAKAPQPPPKGKRPPPPPPPPPKRPSTQFCAAQEIANELRRRGSAEDAARLERTLAFGPRVGIPANVIEAIRLLGIVQAEASKDQHLINVAARTSMLSYQIQQFHSKGATNGNPSTPAKG
jgi:hypothetical protein